MIRVNLQRLLMLIAARSAAVALALFLGFAPAMAAFDEAGAGARSAGMADVGTAVADDANAAFFNPAGLVQIGERQVSAEMSQQNRGLSDGSKMGGSTLGYVHPLSDGRNILGVGYRTYSVSDVLQERTYLLGAGRRLKIDNFELDGVLSVGANLKMLQRSFNTDGSANSAFNDAGTASGTADPVLSGGASATAFSVDAGALYQFGPRLNTSVGLALINANQPDIGIRDADKVTGLVKLGLAHRPRWGLVSAEVRRANRIEGSADNDFAIGLERHFRAGYRSAFTLRGGYATGARGYKAMTAGASYHFGRFALDYAFSFPIGNLSGLDGSQRIGVSMRFGAQATAPVSTRYEKIDLIRAFESNSLTAHILMTENGQLSPEGRSLMNRLAARRFSLDDPGLSKASDELRDALKDGRDWTSVTAGFTRGMNTEDARRAAEALDGYAAGDIGQTLARIAVLSPEVQKRPTVVSLQSMALGERAAASFRMGNLVTTTDAVRRLTILLPSSERVHAALRQLQALQVAPPVMERVEPVETPAPAPVETAAPAAPAPAEVPATSVVAPVVPEPVPTVVPEPVSTPAPVAVPAVAPVPTSAPDVAPKSPAKPTPQVAPVKKDIQYQPKAKPMVKTAEMERAWIFYREAVAREVSDYEKIEILEDMLMRFGETEAAKINKELGRLRERVGKNGTKNRPNK